MNKKELRRELRALGEMPSLISTYLRLVRRLEDDFDLAYGDLGFIKSQLERTADKLRKTAQAYEEASNKYFVAVEQLGIYEQEVILKRYVERKDVTSIANEMAYSYDWVRKRLHEGEEHLLEIVNKA